MALEAVLQFIPTSSSNLGDRKQIPHAQAHWPQPVVTTVETDMSQKP